MTPFFPLVLKHLSGFRNFLIFRFLEFWFWGFFLEFLGFGVITRLHQFFVGLEASVRLLEFLDFFGFGGDLPATLVSAFYYHTQMDIM